MTSESQKRAIAKYHKAHPEKVREARARYEAKRPSRDRAEYMREYRRRRKAQAMGDDTATTL
jgi:hypothetical protein